MSAEERERIRIDFWDRIVQSHGIPTRNDDEIEFPSYLLFCVLQCFTLAFKSHTLQLQKLLFTLQMSVYLWTCCQTNPLENLQNIKKEE